MAGSLDDSTRLLSSARRAPARPLPAGQRPTSKCSVQSGARRDAELEDLIAAAELMEGGPNVNQELGQILNKTPNQVSKLKERLLAKEGVKELYAARQAANQPPNLIFSTSSSETPAELADEELDMLYEATAPRHGPVGHRSPACRGGGCRIPQPKPHAARSRPGRARRHAGNKKSGQLASRRNSARSSMRSTLPLREP